MQFLFPNEILQLILSHLSTRDLFRLKFINRQFRQIIKQIESRQLSQIQSSFPDDNIQQFVHICRSANYLLFDHYFYIFKDNKSRDFWRSFLNISCISGDYYIPKHLIKKYQNNQKLKKSKHWNDTFFYVCRGGNIKLVKKLIKLGANNWNWGLEGACRGGHIEIIKLMIEKLEQLSIVPDWNWGLYEACYGGHIEIIKLMIEKGADAWNCGLGGACLGGHIGIVEFMIEKGADDWNEGLEGACLGRHIEIVKFMIEKGAMECYYCHKPILEH